MTSEKTKICTGCKNELPVSAYSLHPGPNGRPYPMARCKKCRSNEEMEKYRNDPVSRARTRAQQKEYYERSKNSDRRRDYELRRTCGITLALYNEMLEKQGGRCAICGCDPTKNGQRLAVDHCHEQGHIRGLLCTRCNLGIGYFDDDPQRSAAAAEYCANIRAMSTGGGA